MKHTSLIILLLLSTVTSSSLFAQSRDSSSHIVGQIDLLTELVEKDYEAYLKDLFIHFHENPEPFHGRSQNCRSPG